MKKLMLLPLAALVGASFTANAQEPMTQNFDYISGGLQISKFSKDLPSGLNSMTDGGAGLYLRGSWNFTDNFFVEMRGDAVASDDITVSNGLMGLGYYMPINEDFTVYGMAGFAKTRYEFDAKFNGTTFTAGVEDSGFTGEMGARYQVMDKWMIEPAVRFAAYDDTMYELRLGNNVQVTDHVSLEANVSRLDFDFNKETNFQLGARYNF
ncbi:porin family protein [Photobacterium rosenbergii]|uniref:Porin family protein n=1 Tax=Photobacterium rosenbergii TaxID=294936 RepID=A0A2T3NHQ0_9GAMM|nr:porin family protein [Photobacterium rosenbergii]PSW14556.1 porin family protein [Photobacterium rosenbergii]